MIDRRDIINLTLVRSNFFSSLDEYKYAGPQIQQGTLSPNIGVSHINLMRGAEISFFPQPLLKLLKVGLQSLQMGSVAPMKLLM